MKLSAALCAVCLMSMILMPATQGAVIYDENDLNTNVLVVLTNRAGGAGFQTTSTDFVLTDVSLSLSNFGGTATGTASVSVYKADGAESRPLTVETVLNTIDISTLAFDFSLKQVWSGNYTLAPSTNYWLVVANTGGSGNLVWGVDTSPTNTYPSLGLVQSDDGTTFTAPDTAGKFGASISAVSAVPEPSTLATITAGLVTLSACGYVRRRRRT